MSRVCGGLHGQKNAMEKYEDMFKTNDWRMNEKELANGFSLSLGEFARNKSKGILRQDQEGKEQAKSEI